MTQTQIGMGHEILYGFADGNRVPISNTVEQICAFIMQHSMKSVMITSVLDVAEIETSMGLIMYCRDQEFLITSLIPALAPMQMGQVEAPAFVPHVTQDDYLISNVRFRSAAGHSIYTMTYEDGYPAPYERVSGYFPSETVLHESYPDSISSDEAMEQATQKGWL